jgi:Beta-propeller repeat
MKTLKEWGNVMKYIGVATLMCAVLLLIVLGGGRKQSLPGRAETRVNGAVKPSPINQDSKWLQAYGKLPLRFEENIGQTAREVRYVAHGGGYELFLTPQEAVVALRPSGHLDLSPRHRFATLRALREARRNARQADQTTTLRLQLEGSNPQPQIAGAELLPGKVNYFIGNDPKKWHTDVPSYQKVRYVGVYPGVDLVFYGNENRLEYDFIVAPGADPAAIALKVNGARKMRIDSRGDVVISVPAGEVRLQKPVIYQQVKGERRKVAGTYTIADNRRITFSVPRYDRNKPLILDPVLNYSTYVGGSSEDAATGIAVDSSGDAYISGATYSTDFPTTSNALIPQPLPANTGTSYAAFVAELDPTGTTLLYSSYIAGSIPGEAAFGIAADPTGKAVYVTGQTFSPDFPTASTITGFKTGNNPTAINGTSFLVKIDPTQTSGAASLVYSTFIGGTNGPGPNGDLGQAVAADASGVAYVTGLTDSSPGNATDLATFPIVGGFQTTLGNSNGGGNAFLSKIDTTVSGSGSLVSSSYLGGDAVLYPSVNSPGYGDAGFGIAVDSSAYAYILGTTTSSNLGALTTTGLALTYPAGNISNTSFFAKINTATAGTQSLSYLTYLGGSGADFGIAIALGPSNVAYLTGSTSSVNFPVSNGAYQPTTNGSGVAFISLIDTSQSPANSLTRATFLGGTNGDEGRGMEADSQGNAYVAGATSSVDFPVTQGALQSTLAAHASGNAFVSELNPSLSALLYSSYFGGSGSGNTQEIDAAFGIALDSSTPPNVYIAGQTSSTNLPILGTPVPPLNVGLSGPTDAFVAKLSLIPNLTIAPSPFVFPGVQQVGVASAPQAFVVTNNTSSTVTFNSIVVTGVSPAANTDFAILSNGCSPSVAAGASPCTVNVTFTPSVAAVESANLVITAVVTNGGQSSTQVFTVNLSGTGSAAAPGITLDHTSVPFSGQMLTTTSAAIPVKLTSSGLGPLTINLITASGDFAQTNNCPTSPATLAAAGTCTINVTFAPTATGARTGTLTITDNTPGSPQMIPLTGTGWDFQITATSPQSGKNPLIFNATMTPLGGFNQSVAMTCTAPTGTTCTVTTPVTAADGMTAQSVQVTVTRSSNGLVLPTPPTRTQPILIRQIVPLILAFVLLFLLPKAKGLRVRLGMASALVLLLALAGCSSSSPITGNLTITGTSSGTAGSESHSATVAVTVK